MADEKENPPSARAEMPRVRRRAPTIDLKATEVSVEPPPQPPEQELEATAPSEYSTQPPAYEMAGAPPQEPASQETMQEPPAREPPQEPSSRESPPEPRTNPPRRPFLGEYGVEAGIVSAITALLIFGVLWLAGMFSAPATTAALSNSSDPRLAALETRVRELANRPAPQADTKAVDDLAARLAQVESAQRSAGNATPSGNVAALEESIKTLSADIARRADENAVAIREARSRADAALAAGESARQAADAARQATERSNNLEPLNTRIAALERAVQTLTDNVAKISATNNDKPLRAAVAAQALRAAVERGDSFEAELAAAKAAAPDPKVLAPLDAFAATGLPTPTMLARQLVELAPTMLKATTPPAPTAATTTDGGFLDRLQANAEKLVRIRPVNQTPADGGPAGVIRSAQTKVVRGDLPGALAELRALPDNVRAPADEWIKKAEACHAALNAGRRFATDALAALGKSP
jgi:hypothetical protein